MGIGESVRGVGGWWRGQGVTFWLRVWVMVGRGGWVGGGTVEQGAVCGGGVASVGVVGVWAEAGEQSVGRGACVGEVGCRTEGRLCLCVFVCVCVRCVA